jgi:hypothetical protein
LSLGVKIFTGKFKIIERRFIWKNRLYVNADQIIRGISACSRAKETLRKLPRSRLIPSFIVLLAVAKPIAPRIFAYLQKSNK